jgi:hypothetical protein
VNIPSRSVAAVGFVVCIQAMTWACGSRSIPADVPVPPQETEVPEASTRVEPLPEPEPPPSPPAPVTPPPKTSAVDCALIAEAGESIATVALGDIVDPSNAPHASNESERLLFRQLYETLVRVDCDGHVRPGLAGSWRLDADGRTWIVTLRDDAHFSDGTPVRASDVRASWTYGTVADELPPHVRRLVETIDTVDDRSLAITLRRQQTNVPLALAHPDLAIARHTADSPWPLGTRIDGAAAESAPGTSVADPVITLRRDDVPSIRFLVAARDPRDLLDERVDLMLTRDPATLAYAATLPHFQSVPLEWHRIHVLLTPGRTRGAPLLSEDVRQVLANDAVRGEARGAAGPFWWQMLDGCGVAQYEPRNQPTSTPRIVYDARDGVARDLAERFVGLARSSGPAAAAILDVLLPDRPRRTFERSTGLTGEPLAVARRRGADAGYVVSLDRRPLDPCRDIQMAIESMSWLDPETIVPLVETRLRAIVRRGRSGISAEWDGGLLIAGTSVER